MIKVLQICFVYPPSFSGYGRQLATVNRELSTEKSMEISITVLTGFGAQSELGIDVNSMLSKSRNNYKFQKIIFFLFSFFYLLRCYSYFKNSDIIHVVKGGPETILPCFFGRLYNKKVIIKVAQDDVKPNRSANALKKILRDFRNFFLKKANKIVALSDSIESDLLSIGYSPEKIIRIPNSVDTIKFSPGTGNNKEPLFNRLDISDYRSSQILLYVGSISRRKGIEDLLNAIDLINFEQHTLILFVGPLYDIENFQYKINDLNKKKLNIKLKHIGFTENIAEYYKISDFLLLPSYSEGMPNVVLESISSDVPVILSDIPIHLELCKDKIGLTFKLGDPSSLSLILRDISRGIIKKDNFSPRGVALNKYSLASVARKYWELYSE